MSSRTSSSRTGNRRPCSLTNDRTALEKRFPSRFTPTTRSVPAQRAAIRSTEGASSRHKGQKTEKKTMREGFPFPGRTDTVRPSRSCRAKTGAFSPARTRGRSPAAAGRSSVPAAPAPPAASRIRAAAATRTGARAKLLAEPDRLDHVGELVLRGPVVVGLRVADDSLFVEDDACRQGIDAERVPGVEILVDQHGEIDLPVGEGPLDPVEVRL